MSGEETRDVDDIKIRLGDEIPVEEEPTTFKAEKEPVDVVSELRNLGRQFGETVRSAWYSEERKHFESEMREGVESFTKEVDKAFREIKSSKVAQQAKDEAAELKTKVESSDITDSAKAGIADGLKWFATELAKLAEQFTPEEKQPADEAEKSE